MNSSELVHPRILLRREENITLDVLTKDGIEVPLRGNKNGRVVFTTRRAPFEAREGSGWMAVSVKSPFGEESILLYEPWENGRVSGIVRLVRPTPLSERKKEKK